MRVISAAGVSGTGGIASCGFSSLSDHATMLGSATSCLQFDVGRGHDGLRAVVGFGRNGNDGLRRQFWIGLRGLRCLRVAGIEWGKIFRGRVIDDLRAVERWPRYDLRLEREEARERDEQRERDDVICAGLEEAGPRKAALHEYVGPERRGAGLEFQGRQAAGEDQVAQIAEEDSRPGGQLDQKPRNGLGLLDFVEGVDCGHLTYSRCGKRSWDSREDICGLA